jgi:acyl carrier protein
MFVEGPGRRCRSLKRLISGGEKLSAESIRVCSRLLAAELHHSYGPTEASIAATEWTCTEYADGIVPMGRPLGNVCAYVLDRHGGPVPLGAVGELCIGGAGVGLGYAGRPDLTAECFVPDSFAGSGSRLYRTGDRVRYLADGNLEFLGRLDSQVKIRGHRIELAEIEQVLGEHESVANAVVVVWDRGDGEQRLAAYVQLRESISTDVLLNSLKRRLPDYMLPSAIVPLEEIPVAINGKADRRALPSPERPPLSKYNPPADELESKLASLWAELFCLERVGVTDDFFELGGHSLLATRMLARVNSVFGLNLPLRHVFECRTIGQLAGAIRAEREMPTMEALAMTKMPRIAISLPSTAVPIERDT